MSVVDRQFMRDRICAAITQLEEAHRCAVDVGDIELAEELRRACVSLLRSLGRVRLAGARLEVHS